MTAEEKQEIKDLVLSTLRAEREAEREVGRQRWQEAKTLRESRKVTKLFLVTMTGHHVAFPDERGRSIMNQAIYARIEIDEEAPDIPFGAKSVLVVAYGEGRLLSRPIKTILSGGSIVAMVEVPDDFLEGK